MLIDVIELLDEIHHGGVAILICTTGSYLSIPIFVLWKVDRCTIAIAPVSWRLHIDEICRQCMHCE